METFVYISLVPIVAFVLRLICLIYKILTSDCKLTSHKPLRTIICIGSGGHTTEILRITKSLNVNQYQPILYILADNDISSEVKIHETEKEQQKYIISRIPRSRNVRQSYSTSVLCTMYAILHAIPVVYSFKPNIIFCNGPGTCIPICAVSFLLRCLFLIDCRIVFIESVCRVRTLSLTGKILQYFADLVIVQWPELRDICFRAKYFGRLT